MRNRPAAGSAVGCHGQGFRYVVYINIRRLCNEMREA
jgi:hypothetical protein